MRKVLVKCSFVLIVLVGWLQGISSKIPLIFPAAAHAPHSLFFSNTAHKHSALQSSQIRQMPTKGGFGFYRIVQLVYIFFFFFFFFRFSFAVFPYRVVCCCHLMSTVNGKWSGIFIHLFWYLFCIEIVAHSRKLFSLKSKHVHQFHSNELITAYNLPLEFTHLPLTSQGLDILFDRNFHWNFVSYTEMQVNLQEKDK